MKRMIAVVVVVSVLFTAGIANAGFMYYLMPTGGNTSSYTITGSGTAASPYTVNIAAGTGAGSIPFVLYAAIQSGDGGANDGWFGTDFLAISNAASSGSQLIGTFATAGASPVMTLQGSTPYASGNTATWLEGDPGIVTSHGVSKDAGASAGSGMPAQVFWSGGTVSTNNGLGTVGPQWSAPVANLSGFTGSVPNWGNYITPNAGTDTVGTTSNEVTGSSPKGVGWYDVPLGTFKYTYGASGLTSGQSTQLDIHQVAGGSVANPAYYGGDVVNNVTTTQGIQAMVDNAVVVNYGTLSTDGSLLALTPASVSLGRLLLGSTGYINSGGSIANTGNAGGYTLAGTSVTPQTAAGSVGAGTVGTPTTVGPLYLQLATSTTGSINGTLGLTNTGNSGDASNHSMAVGGIVVANRPLTVTTTVPGGSVLQGAVVNLTLSDGGAALDNANTKPNVVQVGGGQQPGYGGVYVNATATSVISQTNHTATLQMVYNNTGSFTSGLIDLGAGGIVTQENGLFTGALANSGIPSGTYTMPVPLMTIGLGNALAGGAYGTPLTGSGLTSGLVLSASLGSTLLANSGSLHANGTAATLFGTGMNGVSLQWRQAKASDTTALPAGSYLASDVANVNVAGITGAFAMQMQYDYTGNASAASAAGKLFLGYLVPTGTWTNAGIANDYQGNRTLASVLGSATSLTNYVGDWGIDTTGHTVWAVLSAMPSSNNGLVDFAAPAATIPEPSTLALLAAGIAAGLVWRRRKRA
jgi:hypothetical protein